MTHAEINRQTDMMKKEIERYGLRLEDIWSPKSEDPGLEWRQVRSILDWVKAYKTTPLRAELKRRGYEFPPVEPDIDPETDWQRFERWIKGEPLNWSFVAKHGPIPAPATLSDAEVESTLAQIEERLAEHRVEVGIGRELPPRLRLTWLRAELTDTDFEVLGPKTFCVLDGCSGYCPGCFQRPWCESGSSCCWEEDEEAGRMVVPAIAEPFVKEPRPTAQQLRDAETAW